MNVVNLLQTYVNEGRVYTMANFQKLSETEMEVMQIIWASDHPITSGELLDIFARNKGKKWKGTNHCNLSGKAGRKGPS